MSDNVKFALHRLLSSTAPNGVVTGKVGPFEVVLSIDGSDPVVTGIAPETAINAGRFDFQLSEEVTLKGEDPEVATLVGYTSFNSLPKGSSQLIELSSLSGEVASPQEGDLVVVAVATADPFRRIPEINTPGYTNIGGEDVFNTGDRSSTMQVWGKIMGSVPDSEVSVFSAHSSQGRGTAIVRVYRGFDPSFLDTADVFKATFDSSQIDPPLFDLYPEFSNIVVFGAAAHASDNLPVMSAEDLLDFYGESVDLAGRSATPMLYAGDYGDAGGASIDLDPWFGAPAAAGDTAVMLAVAIPPRVTQEAETPTTDPEPTPPPEPAPDDTLPIQNAEFGDQTRDFLGGGHRYQLAAEDGTPYTNVAAAEESSLFAVTSEGVVTVATSQALSGLGDQTVRYVCNEGTGTLAVSVVPNAESVGTTGGFADALSRAIMADAGGTVFVPKMLDTEGWGTFEPSDKTFKPTGHIFVRSSTSDEITGGFTHGCRLRHCSGVQMSFLDFHDRLGNNSGAVELQGDCLGCGFFDSLIHGKYLDPLGDYSGGYTGNTSTGISTVSSGRGLPGGVAVERCKIFDLGSAGSVKIGSPGGLQVRDCEIYNCYYDAFNVAPSGDGLGGPFIFERNFSWYWIGDPRDQGNPHIDGMCQFISAGSALGDEVLGVEIRQNVVIEMDGSNGEKIHGVLTGFEDADQRLTLVDPIYEYNISSVVGNHAATVKVNGGTFRNNLIVSPAADWKSGTHSFGKINLEIVGDNTINVLNNIVEDPTEYYGPNATTATINESDNLIVGLRYSTHTMESVFGVSEAYTVRSFQELIGRFSPNPNGPAIPLNAGAVDTGATFGEIGDPTGWSVPA